jgi:glycosyltransferase involved in cell wall biosynthesis
MMNKQKNILMIIYSDIGKSGKVGARFTKVAKKIIDKARFGLKIIARDNYSSELDVDTPFYKALIAKIYRFVDIYIVPIRNKIDQKIFDKFSLARLSKDERSFALAHVDGTTPKTIFRLKKQNSKVIYDVQMSPRPDMLHLVSDEFVNMLGVSDHITVPSEFTKEVLIKECGVNTPMTVIPFGVDSEKFTPAKNKAGTSVRFAFAGYISERKGSDYLLAAWKELNMDKAELYMYGRTRKELRKTVRSTGSPTVKFPGFVDTAEELPKNHVFVFPSNQEGSAKAIYEAMACGLPVITTPNAGSVIRDRKEGFIIPPRDKEAIKEKMLYFYNNPEKIEEMGKKARKLAEEYTWERYAENIYNVYNKVLNEDN